MFARFSRNCPGMLWQPLVTINHKRHSYILTAITQLYFTLTALYYMLSRNHILYVYDVAKTKLIAFCEKLPDILFPLGTAPENSWLMRLQWHPYFSTLYLVKASWDFASDTLYLVKASWDFASDTLYLLLQTPFTFYFRHPFPFTSDTLYLLLQTPFTFYFRQLLPLLQRPFTFLLYLHWCLLPAWLQEPLPS